MTVQMHTTFDIDAYKRAYERWDLETLIGLYADDVEQIQMDDATPPRDPSTNRGKERLGQMFRHCKDHGVTATVDNTVPGDERAAATVTCEFPTGRKVVANVILDLRDGRIVREFVTAARDAE